MPGVLRYQPLAVPDAGAPPNRKPYAGFCFSVAVWRDLRPGHDSSERSDVWRLPKALLVVVNGGLLLVSLGALMGVWFGRTGGT